MGSGAEDVFAKYRRMLAEIAYETDVPKALERAVKSYRGNVARVLKLFPDSLELAREARRIKEFSIDHMDELVEAACRSFERNKARCYLAKDAQEANKIVGEIVGTGKLVVKGKSMVTEEIGLREYLQGLGNEVWETDLGELIIQLAGERPMHLTSPSIHMTRERVAKLFKEKLGFDVKPEIPELVAAARRFLRDKLVNADVGISGANVVAAET
jgi:L-lactate dehydrogenase complex protein LldG